MRVAVIGGGIVGLSAARFLSERGHAVTLFERFPLFHDRGSSHGRTRIVRRAYPDAFYTECMAEAYPMWGDLEAASGKSLLHECGLFYFGHRDSPRIRGVADALTSLNVPHEILGPSKAKEQMSCVELDRDEVGIYTPEAGFVDADVALRATYDLAHAAGLAVSQNATDLATAEADHDAVVVAVGAWVKEFVPLDVKVNLQTFGYVGPTQEGPAWIDDASLTYGIPGDPLGHKIGAHAPGPEIDPNSTARTPVERHIEEIEEVARRRFGIAEPKLAHTKTCLYTNTPTEDFRMGRIGSKGFFASACSGHGFKFGPWIGRLLADMVEGKDSPERYARFLKP